MGSKKIVVMRQVLDDSDRAKIDAIIEKAGYTVEYFNNVADSLPSMADAEIAYGDDARMTKAGNELKWYCSATAGINQFTDETFANPDCILSNASGAYGITLSEHMIMVTLMLLRRYPEYDELVRNHVWQNKLMIRSICDSTIVVLGTGDIGTRFAERTKGFQPAKIIGVNRTGHYVSDAYDEMVSMDDLDRVLPETDVLVMSLPGTAEAEKMLSKERIALLKETAYVVNVGRGNSIDQAALVEALNAEKIAGAALDVMEVEPIPEGDPLWTAKNALITPHISGQYTLRKTRELNVAQFCEDLENYFAGRPLAHAVDRKKGY